MVFRLVGWILSNFCSRKAPKLINQTIIAKLLCMWLPRYVFFSYFFWKKFANDLLKQKGHLEIVQFLIEKGANIDQVNYKKQTPLWIAAKVRIYCFSFSFSFLSFFCVCVFFFAYLIHNIQCLRGRSKWSKLPSSYWRMMQMLIIQTVIWLFFATLVKYAIFVCICEYVFEIIFHIENRKQNCMNLSSWL